MTAYSDSPAIRLLTAADLRGALALTREARWNQDEADWRLMLQAGRAFGVERQGRLVATGLALPYRSGRFGWISMILVTAEQRRLGLATAMMQRCLATLEGTGLTAVLDATPEGRAIYLPLGFVDCWGLRRYLLREPVAPVPPPKGVTVRAMAISDLPAVTDYDAAAFGASRAGILANLFARAPRLRHVAEREGELVGYALGRDGHAALHLGPVAAEDQGIGIALASAALAEAPRPVYLDALEARSDFLAWLEARGAAFERPYTRMKRGAAPLPGEPDRLMTVAGPELG